MDLRGDGETTLLTSGETDRIAERLSVGCPSDTAGYFLVSEIPQFGGNGEPRFIKGLGIDS
jgi:hypothetical protein